MERQAGYYSLIQYCPDPDREEVANVGVLLFSPSHRFMRAMTASDNRRIRQIFPNVRIDHEWLNSVKESICERLEADADQYRTLKDLCAFADTRANEMRISTPRPIMVVDPERQLRDLYEEYFGQPPKPAKKDRVMENLDTAFRSLRFEGRIQFRQTVKIPVVDIELRVPYVYKNGCRNLVVPRHFTQVQPAMQLAFESIMLAKHAADSRLIVIPSFEKRQAMDGIEGRVTRILEETPARVVMESDLDAFLEEVALGAHA